MDNSRNPSRRGGAGLGCCPAFPGTPHRTQGVHGTLRVPRDDDRPAGLAAGVSRETSGPRGGSLVVGRNFFQVGDRTRWEPTSGGDWTGPGLGRRPPSSSRPSLLRGRHLHALMGTSPGQWGSLLPWQHRRLGPRSHGHRGPLRESFNSVFQHRPLLPEPRGKSLGKRPRAPPLNVCGCDL